jgi:hypothetical protein
MKKTYSTRFEFIKKKISIVSICLLFLEALFIISIFLSLSKTTK